MPINTQDALCIKTYLSEKKQIVDNHLKKLFLKDNNYLKPARLWDAIRYSVLEGGKRIRAILCIASYESLKNDSVSFEDCLTVASCIELVHAMSLIHDDLPLMDNDDLRRGKPSCHKAFGETTALLAGDTMISLPFHIIIENCPNITSHTKLQILDELSKTLSFGLVPGQIMDLEGTEKSCDLKTIEEIYKLKTAQLIKSSVLCGAYAALNEKNTDLIQNLHDFGIKIGIAFQILDDILDITSDTKTLGKTSHKDEKQKKSTYPMLIGIKKSKEIAASLIEEAKFNLKTIKLNSDALLQIADYMMDRKN